MKYVSKQYTLNKESKVGSSYQQLYFFNQLLCQNNKIQKQWTFYLLAVFGIVPTQCAFQSRRVIGRRFNIDHI